MKARFLALAALVLGLASCQTEPEGLNVNVGGEVDTTITVTIPDTETRAGGNNSAVGAFGNVDLTKYTIRYIFEVYYGETGVQKQVYYTDNMTASFPVRLVPGRHYNFVAWADIVPEANVTEMGKALPYEDKDVYYETEELTNITIIDNNNEWKAMDETRDAYTGFYNTALKGDEYKYTGTSSINIQMTRPFAKLRVITTDMNELNALGITPVSAKVTYSAFSHESFNALSGTYSDDTIIEEHIYEIANYADQTGANKVLFTDYFFADDNDVVKFQLDVYEAGEQNATTLIKHNDFTTDIPVKRNYLTTIQGNVLTDGNKITVTVENDGKFENVDDHGNTTDPNYEYKTISSDKEFLEALETPGKYIVISDLHVAKAGDTVNTLATRATNGKTVLINLNGKTITVDNQSNSALVTLGDNDTLIFAGEGEIEATDTSKKLVDGGNVVVTGAAEVDEKAADAKTGIEALNFICENGGEFTFNENLTIEEVILVSTAKPIVINGANHTLTSYATRAIRATVANANIVVNDLNVVVETERVGSNDIRGISIDNVTGVELTLNNCSVIFNHPSGNDWAYAVNVTGGSNHDVTINGGTYNGANVINVRGEKQTVVVKNATLTSLYPNNDMYFGACIYVVQQENSSVYAEGNTFNGNNAWAFNIGYTPIEEKNNTDNTKYVAAKVGDAYYYNIAEAIAAAEDSATVKVLQRHDCNVGATVAAGKTLTLDLNGKTITGTDSSTGSYALITNKGNLTITGNGKMTLKAENNRYWNSYSSVISNTVGGNLVVENATIEHLGGTDMAYGIDNLTNGKGTSAVATINEGAIVKSPYRAIRQFLNGVEANNSLTVNDGAVIEGANKSIWMQDPSANANTGKLVVNEGATLNGDVYLYVCEGSTEWPVSVSIAASAVNGEVLTGNVPEAYVVVNTNGVWTVKSKELADFEAAIAKGGNVTLANDMEISEPIVVTNSVVIDLNGKTVTAPSSSAFVANTGAELTIKNGKVVAYESTVRAIGGKAVIESGEYTSTGTALDSPATYRYSLDCREGGELIINGGTFKSNNGMINVSSTVTINGGKFENIVEKSTTRHFAYVSALLTINDGEFYGKANSSAGGCFFCGAAAGCDIQVKGGKFTSLWTSGSVNRIFEVYYGGTINVTGGMFNTNGGIATFVTENTDEATKAAYPYVAK